MFPFCERRTCLCIQSENGLGQQIIYGRLRLCGRADDDDFPIENDSFQGRNCGLVELVINQLFHFLVQKYKKIIIF